MKKVNNQSLVKTTTGVNEIFIKCAKILVSEIKSPAVLLNLMVDVCWYLEEFDNARGVKCDAFENRLFIRLVVQPWFAGGEDVIINIAKGIKEMTSSLAIENYGNYLSKVFQAFGFNLLSGYYASAGEEASMLATLLKMDEFIAPYQLENDLKNRDANLSKVA
ncbi:MAG: hypothetical protein ABIP35_06330 [Ginsengibacter sp.]